MMFAVGFWLGGMVVTLFALAWTKDHLRMKHPAPAYLIVAMIWPVIILHLLVKRI